MLTWDDSYAIVLALMEHHSDRDISEVGLDELHRMVVALPNFADDPSLANEGILNGLLREWFEESGD